MISAAEVEPELVMGCPPRREAVELYREQVEGKPDAYLPAPAGSVNNLPSGWASPSLSGLTAGQEAVNCA